MDYNVNTSLTKQEPFNKYSIYWLASFGAITAIVWNIPFGSLILYPFTILGTWFHEMAHGLAALVLGGNFHHLQINPDGSGVAYFSGDLFLGGIGMAMVAFAGPIGPTLAGTLFIMASANRKATRLIVTALGLFMIASAIIWVRSPFGVIFVIAFGLLLTFVGIKSGEKLKQILLQFLGVQAIVSVYQSIGYLFSSGAEIGGNSMKSDTGFIEHYLFLPYWFWAVLILAISLYLFYLSMKFIYLKSKESE